MIEDASVPDINDIAAKAIRSFVSQLSSEVEPHVFTRKFILIVETMTEDGERGLWFAQDNAQTEWDSMGLLAAAQAFVSHCRCDE